MQPPSYRSGSRRQNRSGRPRRSRSRRSASGAAKPFQSITRFRTDKRELEKAGHPDLLEFSISRVLARSRYEQVFEMSRTDFTFNFGPLVADAVDAELELELALEDWSLLSLDAVISTL